MTGEVVLDFMKGVQEKASKFTAELIDMAIEDSKAKTVEEL